MSKKKLPEPVRPPMIIEHKWEDHSEKLDPNELHEKLLKDNNLKLDFDVLEGTIATKYGIIKLEKPTLVIKATYVQR
jgi:hypothetical protein